MTRPLVLLLTAAFVLSSHVAAAKPKVALTQIEGDASGDLRDAVAEALEGKELSLIGSKEVNRAVDKLGDLADLTEKDFKKLANELEADAVVAGKLDKVGRAKTLKFRLYVHKKMAKGFTVSFKDAKSEKFRSLLHDKMLDKIGVTPGAASAGASEGDGDDKRPRAKKAAEEDDDPLASKNDKKDKKSGKKAKVDEEEDARPKKAKAAEDDAKVARKHRAEEDEDSLPVRKSRSEDDTAKAARSAKAEEDEDSLPPRKPKSDDDTARSAPSSNDAKAGRTDGDEDAPRKAKKKVAAADGGDEVESSVVVRVEPPHAANRAAIRLDVGVSMLQRTFLFNAEDAGDVPNKPKNASLQPVPGVRFETEIYPLAFSGRRSVLSGFGIGVEYDKTIRLTLASNTEPGVAIPVKQSHYSAGLRYRMVFGKTETSPTLTFGAGYGKRLFSTDRSKLTMQQAVDDINRDTPTSEYTVIDPGLMFRLPVTRMVAFAAGGRGMIVIDAGSIQNAGSYGRARVYGVEGFLAADIVFGNRFALRLAGEIAQVAFQFQGVGELSNNLDGDPSSRDVKALTDRSIGGAATLAVMY